MNPTWSRILMAGGFAVGIAIVVPLAVIAYALLSGDDGPEAEVARITQTATVSPTVTTTSEATPSPSPPTIAARPSRRTLRPVGGHCGLGTHTMSASCPAAGDDLDHIELPSGSMIRAIMSVAYSHSMTEGVDAAKKD